MRTDDTQPSADLTAVLADQVLCAEAMLAALEREHEALVGGSPDALAAASDAKAQLVETLETLESQRRTLTADGTQQSDAWRRLRDVLGECKQRNQRNGALLKARADNVRVALNALRGAQPELYGSRGQQPSRSGARPLGTA
jgi:flagellar biosynthesis/type III secretory pathway chaperone